MIKARVLYFCLLIIALLLNGCASYLHTPLEEQQAFDMQPLSTASKKFYDYAKETIPINNHTDPDDPDLPFTIHHLHFPSIGYNGQKDNLVHARFYKNKSTQKTPLVIILPIWGSSTYPADEIADDLIYGDTTRHVVLIRGEKFMLNWDTANNATSPEAFNDEIRSMVDLFKVNVTDIRRIIDWAETQPTIDASRIALIGFSHGALVAAVTATVEPRLRAIVSVMGGTNLHQILIYCSLERTDTLRGKITQRFGWSKDQYQQTIEEIASPLNLVNLQHRVDPQKALIIEAYYDDCIPQQARDDLWKYLGYPEKFSYEYGHKASFLSMTLLGGYSMRHKIFTFLDKRLESEGKLMISQPGSLP